MAGVLVTGITGYIARHVAVQLLDAGHTVRGTARSASSLATVRAEHYGPRGYNVPTGNLPNGLLKIAAIFDQTARLALNDLSNPQHIDAGPVIALLGRPLRDLETMTVAMADSLIEYGLVKSPKR